MDKLNICEMRLSTRGEDVIYMAMADNSQVKEMHIGRAELMNDKVIVHNYVPPNFHQRFVHLNRVCQEKRSQDKSLKMQLNLSLLLQPVRRQTPQLDMLFPTNHSLFNRITETNETMSTKINNTKKYSSVLLSGNNGLSFHPHVKIHPCHYKINRQTKNDTAINKKSVKPINNKKKFKNNKTKKNT